MPNIHWETESKALEMKRFIQKPGEAPENDASKLLITEYIHKGKENKYSPLHNRRTLDQYCYYTLVDTSERDQDQLFSRLFRLDESNPCAAMLEKKYEAFYQHPPILMVDQLWLWILPNGNFRALIKGTNKARLLMWLLQIPS